jgi:hypothetical protein
MSIGDDDDDDRSDELGPVPDGYKQSEEAEPEYNDCR